MASFAQVGKRIRALVFKRGVRESKNFENMAEAKAWAAARELEIELGSGPRRGVDKTLHDTIDRFVKDECPKRGGTRWEKIRLERIKKEITDTRLDRVTADTISTWRNDRLLKVKGSTVRREMNLLKTVFETARRDWGWISANPMADVKRPAPGKARTRTISDEEVSAILRAAGHDDNATAESVGQRMAIAFLIALETGMRAGEIGKAIVSGKVAHIPKTKNGDPRDVPLSKKAVALFARYVPIAESQIDSSFRNARKKAGLTGFTFHDSRATACTRLARVVDVLTLARIIGHRDLKSLQVYYRETADSIADRLG